MAHIDDQRVARVLDVLDAQHPGSQLLVNALIINFIRTPPTFIRTCADECGNPIP